MNHRPGARSRSLVNAWPVAALLLALIFTVTLATSSATAAAPGPVTLWGADAPASAVVDADANAVELGTRFTAVTDGQATGVRFYKTSENSGIHTGSLWSSTGSLLGRVTSRASRFPVGSPPPSRNQ